jgi:hypothetical protein
MMFGKLDMGPGWLENKHGYDSKADELDIQAYKQPWPIAEASKRKHGEQRTVVQ